VNVNSILGLLPVAIRQVGISLAGWERKTFFLTGEVGTGCPLNLFQA
jgi:hypothetical protein